VRTRVAELHESLTKMRATKRSVRAATHTSPLLQGCCVIQSIVVMPSCSTSDLNTIRVLFGALEHSGSPPIHRAGPSGACLRIAAPEVVRAGREEAATDNAPLTGPTAVAQRAAGHTSEDPLETTGNRKKSCVRPRAAHSVHACKQTTRSTEQTARPFAIAATTAAIASLRPSVPTGLHDRGFPRSLLVTPTRLFRLWGGAARTSRGHPAALPRIRS
jgi:hypothetical protein